VFPGAGDFALLTYDNPDEEAASVVDVGDGQLFEITSAADAEVGQRVFRIAARPGCPTARSSGWTPP